MKKTSFREKLWQFRNRTADEICREMGKRRGGILCAVLLGDSFYTEEKVKELYRVAGIGHLLAISGLHISFFGNGLYRGLRKTGFSISSLPIFIFLKILFSIIKAGKQHLFFE